MTAIDFIALVFAASTCVDTWFNGSIFDSWRAWFEASSDIAISSDQVIPRWRLDIRAMDLFSEMVTCKFCVSHHTPWLLACAFFVPALFVSAPWDFIFKIPVYSLAATRIGNIINAFVPADVCYYRSEAEFTIEEENDGTATEPDTGDST